jgi:hypothetical protein
MINELNYIVRSKSGYDTYNVIVGKSGWVCLCPDHVCRDVKFTHEYAVEFYRHQNATF